MHLIGDQQANSKFRSNDFFGGKTLTITHQGKTYRFSKDSIYGYKDKQGNDYRFNKSNHAKYRILENGRIVIYERHNLKSIFKDQPNFDIIDANFRTDEDITKYDTYHHIF